MAEEFVEKLETYKTQGMTEEQFTTAKDIRRKGKNKVGCSSLLNFIIFFPPFKLNISVTAQMFIMFFSPLKHYC